MVEAASKKASAAAAKRAQARPAEPLRGRIPSLLPAQAEALRYFFAAPERWTLRDGGVLRFGAGDASGAGELFELEADGVRLGLRLEPHAAARGEGLRWSDYQGRSRLLAWALAHEAPLMRLSDALGVSLLPVEADPERDRQASARDPDLWLSFAIEEAGGALRGTLRLPASWIDRLLDRADRVYDEVQNLDAWHRLPVPVAVRLSGPKLRGADWRALRPGDVIVLGSRSRPPLPQAFAADRRWPLAAGDGRWRIESPAQPLSVSQENSTMNDNEANADAGEVSAEAASHPAGNLPVNVEFELGSVQLSVGELAALQPGYVFSLPAHLEGANVTIRANGRAAGRGEVVAVGDTLGVRLLSWS